MNPIPQALSESEIDGADPAFAVWQAVLAPAEGMTRADFDSYIRALPQHWRAGWTTFYLDSQVHNGGFHQFFWNSDGALNQETLDDFRLIGAQPFVLLFEEALDVYARHDYAGEKRDSGNTGEAFTEAYRQKRMANLDQAYYKIPKKLPECLADFVRENRAKYIKNPS